MNLKRIEYILAIIAVIGASELEREGQTNSLSALSIILITVSVAPVFVIHAYLHYTKPRAQRAVEDRLQKRTPGPEFDFPWFFVFATALVPESLFLQMQWGYVWIGIVIAAVVFGFLKTRSTAGTHLLLSLPIYIAASMGAPFAVAAMTNPEILVGYFPHQLDVLLGRRVAILFAMSDQFVLVVALILLMGNVWRNSILRKKSINANTFLQLNESLAQKIVKYQRLDSLQDPLSDIPDTIDLFQRAEFRAMVGWGWSIIDRILVVMGPKTEKRNTATALGVKSQFESVYEKRNKTVHEGFTPNLDDAVGLLMLLREIVIALSKVDDTWFTRTRQMTKKTKK